METRGVIENTERAHQTIRFDGLRYGNITPTDIDMLIEYHDKAVILYEFKYEDAPMKRGQKVAIERIVDDIDDSGKIGVAFLCVHDVADCSQDVFAKDARVYQIYYNGKWHDGNLQNVKDKTDSFIKYCDLVEL